MARQETIRRLNERPLHEMPQYQPQAAQLSQDMDAQICQDLLGTN